MSEPYAPDGFTRVTPYLTVNGAEDLLDFIVGVFSAEVVEKTEGPGGSIRHASLRIGDAMVEVADATEEFGPMPGAIHVYVPNVDKAHKRAIERGGQALHEPMQMDYGERASAVRDRHGNHWYIATFNRQETK
jgi:PhnB protein